MRFFTILFLFLVAASGADSDLAGHYSGEWKSNSAGGGGSFRLNLDATAGGTWKCEVVFTYAGAEVKTQMHEVKVNQSKLDAAYDFDLMGNALRSHITGELKGKAFDGVYHTTTVDGSAAVDDGVWNASQAK
ncbi:MAG TPA: hypothetical protein VKU19_32625 [Bryobacteraceae bacterium]|nr:hypothetical protein [Bryobacteraceae bacterium]